MKNIAAVFLLALLASCASAGNTTIIKEQRSTPEDEKCYPENYSISPYYRGE